MAIVGPEIEQLGDPLAADARQAEAAVGAGRGGGDRSSATGRGHPRDPRTPRSSAWSSQACQVAARRRNRDAWTLTWAPGDRSALQVDDPALDRRAVLDQPDRQLARAQRPCGRPRPSRAPNPGAEATIQGNRIIAVEHDAGVPDRPRHPHEEPAVRPACRLGERGLPDRSRRPQGRPRDGPARRDRPPAADLNDAPGAALARRIILGGCRRPSGRLAVRFVAGSGSSGRPAPTAMTPADDDRGRHEDGRRGDLQPGHEHAPEMVWVKRRPPPSSSPRPSPRRPPLASRRRDRRRCRRPRRKTTPSAARSRRAGSGDPAAAAAPWPAGNGASARSNAGGSAACS